MLLRIHPVNEVRILRSF
ncbi:hypothetical protein SAMN04487964_104189 [Marinobacterium sediminicola]|uniref:Uncharacterized protein n=1 Tax=Marinobacterium sediminicola TaxID=518898 RepID=A0ABY1RYW6_9GAMM|nr:hypothetical protein SAMN04487964_104189 [Marinobacterium sediminicola]